jgi:hypothetical protein
MKKLLFLSALASGLFLGSAQAQTIPFPQPSPAASISQNFATSKIEINYARPSARGRKVFGDVVPFGKFWRTGANSATTISFGEDVFINGMEVKAGKYGIVTFPNANEWTVVFTKDLNVTSEGEYKQANDAARFNVKTEQLNQFVETFTIELNNMRNDAADLIIKWEQTQAKLSIKSNYDERLSKQIETVMNKDSRPYYGAANYFYENNKDLNQALNWINKAVEANPKAYWVVLLKAKIQLKLNDKKGAITTANLVIYMATIEKDDSFVKQAEKLIASAK